MPFYFVLLKLLLCAKINVGDNMNNDIDANGMANDFVEEKKDNKNYIVVVVILYIIVIILTILLFIGLKNQKQNNISLQNHQIEINK